MSMYQIPQQMYHNICCEITTNQNVLLGGILHAVYTINTSDIHKDSRS